MSKPGITLEAKRRAEPEVRLAGTLGGLSLPRQVAVLAFWPLLEQILAFFVGYSDQFIAGRMDERLYDKVAVLASMGFNVYLTWFSSILQGAMATGVMALVSRATGARDQKLANQGLGQGLLLGILTGMLSTGLLLVCMPILGGMLGLSPLAQHYARDFIHVFAISCPISGAMFCINAALRGAGDTRTPFIGMCVVNLMNMALSALFVFGPAPIGGHGMAGIAAGTLCGWATGLATVSVILAVKSGILNWTIDGLRPCATVMRRIARVGSPQAIEITCMWAIQLFGVHAISRMLGDAALGAHFITIRMESMSLLPGFAIATAGSALVGQYLGAGSKEMAVRSVRLCWKIAAILMGSIAVGIFVFRRPMIDLLAPGSEIFQQLAGPAVVVCAFSQPFAATCVLLKTSMRTAGATALVMRCSFVSMAFYRVLLVLLCQSQPWFSLHFVWLIFGADLATQSMILSWAHFRGKWLEAKV
ncbi:MATE family efflux transporter [Luteolibacter pohnpeiensis]|uniref:Multidrug-efflux transporter n=1 Tax=Luteolibacter pohnpeiensis TaxID=454153 RepID=A0A934SBP0_9BACT|nr:MATE family efflux transporter [Luteolibacter pohnpeiensis]MBK1882954.1 MATE family efflux transporter [Luteolibacter pohnpeiensis]